MGLVRVRGPHNKQRYKSVVVQEGREERKIVVVIRLEDKREKKLEVLIGKLYTSDYRG